MQFLDTKNNTPSPPTMLGDKDDVTPTPIINPSPNPSLSLKNCVHVFYDRPPVSGQEELGKLYAIKLINILGHFAEYQRHYSAVENYQIGDLNKCGVNILIDSNYYANIPLTFIEDFKNATTQVAWVGENSWKLGNALKETFGVTYNLTQPFTVLDNINLVDDKPSFFKNVHYKGEIFYKYGEYEIDNPNTFIAAYEVAKFDYNKVLITDPSDHEVLVEIEHNYTNEKIPWAIRTRNKFLFAEVPFSFVHEADRYFIFADILFDILGAAPRHNSKIAIIRLEDVDPLTSMTSLERARLIFKNNNVQPQVSIIPIYNNVTDTAAPRLGLEPIPMNLVPEFKAKMQQYKTDSADFIWHGIKHQLGETKNPWEALSGVDYEFWDFSDDVINNRPLIGRPPLGESSESIIDLFKLGADALKASNILPEIWLTPHYHGSSMSNYVFGQLFNWTIGRVVYYENSMQGIDLDVEISKIKFPNMSESAWISRKNYLKNLQVSQTDVQNGLMYPYETYGDIYGQRVFPENLGNVQKVLSEQVKHTRTVNQILTDAKRNLVLRDVWASAFYHPFLLNEPYWNSTNNLGNNELNDLIVGLKKLGYTFTSLKNISQKWTAKAKKPVDRN